MTTIPRPRDSEPGYAGNPSCGWGQWIAHDGKDRPEFVRMTSTRAAQHGTANPQRGDPVDYVGIKGQRGTGRNWSVPWTYVRWFRLRADHPHYERKP